MAQQELLEMPKTLQTAPPTITCSACLHGKLKKAIDEFTPAPATFAQARKYPDAKKWAKAHDEELDKLNAMGAFKWGPLPPGHSKPIPMIMAYRYKRSPKGQITERKARCSIRGDLMKAHVHFEPNHTAAHLADKLTVRLIFAIIASMQLHAEHFVISSAFPYEKYEYEKDLYVKQYPRFDKTMKHPHPTGKVILNVYGTPSGGYYYLNGATKFLKANGFKQSHNDPCIFIKVIGNCFIIVCLNIDDFLVAAKKRELIDTLFKALAKKYKIERLGFPQTYLGWKVTRDKHGSIHLSQPNYAKSLVETMALHQANPRSTLYNPGQDIHAPNDEDEFIGSEQAEVYRKAVGELRYLADCTRPDLAFIASKLASTIARPTKRHWGILKLTTRYVQGTREHGLLYNTPQTRPKQAPARDILCTYADADFAGDVRDRKSTSGAIHPVYGATIHRSSLKQAMVSLSTCEAEYISASAAVPCTALLRRPLGFLNLLPKGATPVYIDNQAAIAAASITAPTKKRKYIQLRFHFLRIMQETKQIRLLKMPTKSMLADICTKAMKKADFLRIRPLLELSKYSSEATLRLAPIRGTDITSTGMTGLQRAQQASTLRRHHEQCLQALLCPSPCDVHSTIVPHRFNK